MDGAEAHHDEAKDVNGRGAGNVAAAAAAVGRGGRLSLHRLRLRRHQGGRLRRIRHGRPAVGVRASKLAGEQETAAANPRHWIVRSSWLFGVNGRNFVETMLGLAQDRDEVVVVRDQIGCPTYTGHLAAGLVRLLDSEDYGVHHMAGGGRCSWYDFAVEIFSQAGRRLPRAVDDQRHARPARPAPRLLGAASASASTRFCCRTGTRASRTTWPSARSGGARVKLLVTGGAGFIGSNFVRYFLAEHPDDSVVVLDKLTYAGRIESLQDLMTYERMEFVQGDIADPEAVRDALEGCDAVVNFAAESHVDRSIEEPGHFIQTEVYGTYVLLEEARAPASSAMCRCPRTRSTARSRRARSPSAARSTPPPRTRPPRPAATCWSAPTATPTGWTRSSAAPRTTTGPTSTPRS